MSCRQAPSGLWRLLSFCVQGGILGPSSARPAPSVDAAFLPRALVSIPDTSVRAWLVGSPWAAPYPGGCSSRFWLASVCLSSSLSPVSFLDGPAAKPELVVDVCLHAAPPATPGFSPFLVLVALSDAWPRINSMARLLLTLIALSFQRPSVILLSVENMPIFLCILFFFFGHPTGMQGLCSPTRD